MSWNCGINYEDNQWLSMAMLIQNTKTGKQVYIPKKDAFEYIRFRTADSADGGRGDRLADAYAKAGSAFANIVPDSDILPCIKRIYTNFKDAHDAQRNLIFRPYGDWVLEEACNCLSIYDTETGRTDLGDGFIVPSDSEQACIVDSMFNQAMSLSSAMKSCCPDIQYPTEQLPLIEDSLRKTNYPLYNIIDIAHTAYLQAHYPTPRVDLGGGIIVPSSDEIYEIEAGLAYGYSLTQAYFNICNDILPVEPLLSCIEGKVNTKADTWLNIFKSCKGSRVDSAEPKSNTLIYVVLGVGLLFLLSRK